MFTSFEFDKRTVLMAFLSGASQEIVRFELWEFHENATCGHFVKYCRFFSGLRAPGF